MKIHLQVTTNRIKHLRTKRRNSLIFFVLFIDKSTSDICKSKNGEAKVLNSKKRFVFQNRSDCALTTGCQSATVFNFFLFDNLPKKNKFEQTDLITVCISEDLDAF